MESEDGVAESKCGESTPQGLMLSGLAEALVNGPGVAEQEAAYEVDGEINKDRGDGNS